jgi:chromate reductase
MDLDVLAVSGSLRVGSYNTLLVRAAQRLAPTGMAVEVYERLGDVPPFNDDLDAPQYLPDVVAHLRERVRTADALLISTPEYNYSVPGVLKNAIDWLSRPYGADSLAHKPIAVMGAASTRFGSVRAQLALRQSLLWTDSLVVSQPELIVDHAPQRFDDIGELVDERTRKTLRELLDALAVLARRAS